MVTQQRALPDDQWARIALLLPGKASDPGRTAADNRLFVEGVLWLARHAVAWRALPDEFGSWNSAFVRFNRWARAGVWDRVFAAVARDADFAFAIIDGTIVRVHQHANGGSRRTKRGMRVEAIGRSRGGLTTKIHLAVDGQGRPTRFALAPGERHELTQARDLLFDLPARFVIADRAYDSDGLITWLEDTGREAVIPQRKVVRKRPPHPPPRPFDPLLYRLRNLVERTIGRLKHYRRVATRYEPKVREARRPPETTLPSSPLQQPPYG